MNKKWLVMIIACCMATMSFSQTLFTYGKHTVDAKEFLRAYNKNNTQPVTNKEKAIKDYLDLYIKSKLKIQEAYDRGYDTLSQIKSEVDNLRSQIVENYMIDPATADKLVNEAFRRSLKDIHIAHIFISFKNQKGLTDTVAAQKKLNEVLSKLKQGADFLSVAEQLSDDPSAKTNKGDIGYITAFTLPYELETLAYSTPVGKYSEPYRSKEGYHIFKNLGERKALGKMKAQQILLAFPPGVDENTKKQIGQLADSLYQRIMAGDDFAKLAMAYSNDYVTAANGGTIPDFSVGRYDPVFENMVWALPKDGAVSKPFVTAYGYHIVKRNAIIPVITNPKDKNNLEEIRQRAMNDSRWQIPKDVVYNHVIKAAGFKKSSYDDAALWAYTDSMIDRRPLGIGKKIDKTASLFQIADSVFTMPQWITYVQTYRYKPDGSGLKSHDQIMDECIRAVALDYYRKHLEQFNDEFRYQMDEFRDGNLFFEIMQREVWNKSQADSVGLVALYEKNPKKYMWKQSAEAVIFFCSDQSISNLVFDAVKKDPAHWQKDIDPFAEKVVADSGRYEWTQIPTAVKTAFTPGMLTKPLINKNDNTASFAYILKVYPQPMQRSFNEAKGLLISDYQTQLENKWVAELKKKYPVVINQKVLAEISK
jgi:peptidyl-prolyl cis-trans isomerase SurA